MLVHADLEVEQHEHRRLQPVGEIEGLRRELEGLAGILRKQHHVLGVAVGRIGAVEHVGLLVAGRHAGRWPGPLHVEDDRGNFGEIAEPDEFLHQRDAGARGRGECAGSIPAGTDDDADRGDLVLALDDGVFLLLVVGVGAQLGAVAGEGIGERGRRRERIPRAHRGAGIDGAERRRRIAVDVDTVADLVGPAHLEAARVLHVHGHPVAAEVKGMHVGADQLFLALELLAEQLHDHRGVDVEQRGERAEIDDVLEQLALARIAVFAVADRGQRHPEHGDVVAEFRRRHRLGRVVEQISAGADAGDVLVQVCGFIATMRSRPPRAPRWPASEMRTSYQVGRPWMLEGKMLRADTGTPMRRTERANSSLALAEPEPLTLANRTTKSFTLPIGLRAGMSFPRKSFR